MGTADPGRLTRRVGSPTPGVAIVDIELSEGDRTAQVLHWRIGTWEKPPLHVRLEEHGRIRELQLVLQDEAVPNVEESPWPLIEEGMPVFSTVDWPPSGFLDESSIGSIGRLPNGQLEASWHTSVPHRVFQTSPSLVLGLAEDSSLCAIRIGPLDDDEWLTLAKADVG